MLAELRDNALFKDPPAKEVCLICFLPMPANFLSCISLSPATMSSVSIYYFAIANEEFAIKSMEEFYPVAEGRTGEDVLDYIMKRVEGK